MVFHRVFVRKTCLPPSCTLRVIFVGRISGSMLAFGVEIFGPRPIFGIRGVKIFGPKNGSCHRFREKKVIFLRGRGVPPIFGPKKRNLGSTRGDRGRAFLGVPGPDFEVRGSSRASARRSRPFLGVHNRRFDPRTGPTGRLLEKKSGRIAAECLRLFLRHFKSWKFSKLI